MLGEDCALEHRNDRPAQYPLVTADDRAEVAGLDASEALIAIARARATVADFRVGDMFALPFGDDHFDVATSFNGIWKGCEETDRTVASCCRQAMAVGWSPVRSSWASELTSRWLPAGSS